MVERMPWKRSGIFLNTDLALREAWFNADLTTQRRLLATRRRATRCGNQHYPIHPVSSNPFSPAPHGSAARLTHVASRNSRPNSMRRPSDCRSGFPMAPILRRPSPTLQLAGPEGSRPQRSRSLAALRQKAGGTSADAAK